MLEDAAANNNRFLNLPGAALFEGGIPVEHDDQVIGGIGVSGASAREDGIIAEAGLNALNR